MEMETLNQQLEGRFEGEGLPYVVFTVSLAWLVSWQALPSQNPE